jgi:hypothetical protein
MPHLPGSVERVKNLGTNSDLDKAIGVSHSIYLLVAPVWPCEPMGVHLVCAGLRVGPLARG